jgi:hypothetical protein
VKRSKIIISALVACVSIAAFVTACKGSTGDRCQIDADCANGVCNKATNTCQSNQTGENIDAAVPDAKLFEDAPDAKVFMDAKIFLDAP